MSEYLIKTVRRYIREIIPVKRVQHLIKPKMTEYLKKVRENSGKMKTSRAKAVYFLLCTSEDPLMNSEIQEILKMSKATVHRALKELSTLNLVEIDNDFKYLWGYPAWKDI